MCVHSLSSRYIVNDCGYVYCRFECGAYHAPGSDIFSSRPIFSVDEPAMDSSRESVCLRNIMSWLERVLTALDCYSWTFGQNLLSPTHLLTGPSVLHRPATFDCIAVLNIVSYIHTEVQHFHTHLPQPPHQSSKNYAWSLFFLRADAVTAQTDNQDFFAHCAFRRTGPSVWNSPISYLVDSSSLAFFKTRLKAFLFARHLL